MNILPHPALNVKGRWKIWYDNGSTYSNEDGPSWLAPKNGVLVIACEDEAVGRLLIHSRDFYWLETNRGEPTQASWFGGDYFGLVQHQMRSGLSLVLFGRTVSNRDYEAVWKAALHDPYLPMKSGYRPAEVKSPWVW